MKTIFPKSKQLSINMMPYIMGDLEYIPQEYRSPKYDAMIEQCEAQVPDEIGKVGYITIREGFVIKSRTQSRGGLHTEKHPTLAWGGGAWGGSGGLFIGSNVAGTTAMYLDDDVQEPGPMGNCEEFRNQMGKKTLNEANTIYRISDSTPHEALSMKQTGLRQFFRLVTSNIGGWYEKHSTHNPKVKLPSNVRVITENKFAA